MSNQTVKEYNVYKDMSKLLYNILMNPKENTFFPDCNKVNCYVNCHLDGRKLQIEVKVYVL